MRRSAERLLAGALMALMIAPFWAPATEASEGPKVVVIGIDGLDWALTQRMMAEGQLPNFQRLAETGTGQPLETSVPPLSPVAWSDFITGMDAGGHGIFDFIHRHPDTMVPYLSTSEATSSGLASKLPFLPERIRVGKYCLPLAGEEQVLLRRGTPFWEVLEENGIETTLIRMPADFPVTGTATRELSGMGTPDILGTYGTSTFYTTDVFTERRNTGGGQIVPMDLWDDIARGKLYGPDDPLLCEPEELTLDFNFYVDTDEPIGKLEIGDQAEAILQIGEWSPWLRIQFDGGPSGIVRFYLRQVEPEVELYASPINIDPLDPALPISKPVSLAAELAEATGLYYTQGMPEDTQALSDGLLTRDEFLAQAKLAGDENILQFRHVLDRFEDGLLYYYFGNLDQISHMMWGRMDPSHPGYVAERDEPYADVIPGLYRQADEILGHALSKLDDDTLLVVMSDHGFTSWKRSFHLNAWLQQEGYLVARDPDTDNDPGALLNVDWSRTRAYGLGFNGLYINLAGRERNGIVPASEKRALLDEIGEKLLGVIDPVTGEGAVTRLYVAEDHFKNTDQLRIGPDMVVGYTKGTRGHSDSAIAEVNGEVLSDNVEEWSGDHGMDHTTVPGVLFTNRPLRRPATSLRDLAASILAEFGVGGFPPSTEE